MEDLLAGLGPNVDIVGMDPDLQHLLDDMLEAEGVAGVNDGGDADFDLSDVAGDVEIGRGARRRTISASRFRSLLKSRLQQAAQLGARRAMASHGPRPSVKTSAPSDAETGILAFQRDGSKGGLVTAGSAVEVVAEPQKPFKPEALIVDENIAPDFLIEEIKIGTKPLFVNTGGVPASMFKADGILGKLLLNKTGQVSQQLSVRARNISTSDRPFYAAMVGWSAS